MIPKFRAWDKKRKKLGLLEADMISGEFQSGKIYDDEDVDWMEIEEFILMQSTGLKDKNGQEIFEWDILGTKDGLLNGFVEYREDLGMWTNSLIRYNNFERLCNVASDREIIGNVFENPELLEATNDRD